MRKKLYDFSIATAVILVLAYAFLFTFSIFMVLNNDGPLWQEYTFLGLLVLSFILIIFYYGIMAVTITDNDVKHGSKKIEKSDLVIFIRHNYRLRYDEIVCRRQSIHYSELDRKTIRKNEIVMQYFIKNKFVLEDYIKQKIEIEESQLNG
jgi:hypothetical protein